MLTGVSARLMSPMGFTSPSTSSSKSFNCKSVTARPCPSTTDAGTGTRFELIWTTSSSSTSSPSVFAAFAPAVAAPCGCVRAGVGVGVLTTTAGPLVSVCSSFLISSVGMGGRGSDGSAMGPRMRGGVGVGVGLETRGLCVPFPCEGGGCVLLRPDCAPSAGASDASRASRHA